MNRNADNSWKPTESELRGKIAEFRKLVCADSWISVDVDQIKRDLEGLDEKFSIDTLDPKELTKLLLTVCDEITPQNYRGQRPPQKSYQREIKGESLFAFCWQSAHFNAKMYFKFALRGKDKGRKAVLVSIHESTQ